MYSREGRWEAWSAMSNFGLGAMRHVPYLPKAEGGNVPSITSNILNRWKA
jgi:hypothetical protein